MTNYRRNFICGGSFFFTVNLADRRQRLLTTHIDLLRQAFRNVRGSHPFIIEASFFPIICMQSGHGMLWIRKELEYHSSDLPIARSPLAFAEFAICAIYVSNNLLFRFAPAADGQGNPTLRDGAFRRAIRIT
jgi:hypothetical protein